MTTDKKQPPDTDRPVLALIGTVAETSIVRVARYVTRHGHPIHWQAPGGGMAYRTDEVVDWREMPSWDRLAILDRYDEERAEWERQIADLTEGINSAIAHAVVERKNLNEALARADRAEKERDEARAEAERTREAADMTLRARDVMIDEKHRAETERDRAIAERDDLGCQLEALRAIQRDDMQVLLGRVAVLETWRAECELADEAVEACIANAEAEEARLRRDDEKGGA